MHQLKPDLRPAPGSNASKFPMLAMEAVHGEAVALAERVGEITPDDSTAEGHLQDAAGTLTDAADLIHAAMVKEATARDDERRER